VTTRGGQSTLGGSEPRDGLQRLIGPGSTTTSSGADPWALEILKAGTPHENIAGQKQRVWLAVAHPVEKRGGFLFRRLTFATAAALVVVCGTAFASAALGHWPIWAKIKAKLAYDSLVGAPAETADTSSKSAAAMRHSTRLAGSGTAPTVLALPREAPVALEPTTAPGLAAGSSTDASRAGARDGEIGRRHDSGLARAGRRPASVAVPIQPGAEDAGPVLAAVRALRRDHNPVRARALLNGYLSAHPDGALVEEALAISIEAAVANRDGDANMLALRYLRLYPSGPFHGLAERALGAGSGSH
jgi:hypothetical protein